MCQTSPDCRALLCQVSMVNGASVYVVILDLICQRQGHRSTCHWFSEQLAAVLQYGSDTAYFLDWGRVWSVIGLIEQAPLIILSSHGIICVVIGPTATVSLGYKMNTVLAQWHYMQKQILKIYLHTC